MWLTRRKARIGVFDRLLYDVDQLHHADVFMDEHMAVKDEHPGEIGESLPNGDASHGWDVHSVQPDRFGQGKSVEFPCGGCYHLKRIDMDMVGVGRRLFSFS